MGLGEINETFCIRYDDKGSLLADQREDLSSLLGC